MNFVRRHGYAYLSVLQRFFCLSAGLPWLSSPVAISPAAISQMRQLQPLPALA
jgi:hypothetical protein